MAEILNFAPIEKGTVICVFKRGRQKKLDYIGDMSPNPLKKNDFFSPFLCIFYLKYTET